MRKRKSNEISDATPEDDAVKKTRLESVENDGNARPGRRSARIAGKAAEWNETSIAWQQAADPDSELDEPVMNDKGKKKKKSSVSKKQKNRKIGQLEVFMNMPIDIFDEIASHLRPCDLRNLAHAWKGFHDLLTSRGSKTVWRAARRSIGLPRCAPDIGELQYADLLFGKGCYLCGAPRAQSLYFSLRLRLCARCRDLNLVSARRICSICDDDYNFLSLLPTESTHYNSYYIEEAKSVWEIYRSLPPGSTERAMFVLERQQRVLEIKRSTALMHAWLYIECMKEADENMVVAMERERSIMEKLKSKGYTDDDLDPELDNEELCKRWLKLTRDPKPLTSRIWKNIEPKLDSVISDRRLRRSVFEEIAAGCFRAVHNCECSNCVDHVDYDDVGSDDDSWYTVSDSEY